VAVTRAPCIAQWDILEFSHDYSYVSPEFPGGYWPDTVTPPAGAWQRSIDAFLADRDAMIALISDPQADLYHRIPHGTCQTLLREALVLARPQRLPRRPDRVAAAPAGVLVGSGATSWVPQHDCRIM